MLNEQKILVARNTQHPDFCAFTIFIYREIIVKVSRTTAETRRYPERFGSTRISNRIVLFALRLSRARTTSLHYLSSYTYICFRIYYTVARFCEREDKNQDNPV